MARSFVASSSQYLSGDIPSALPSEFFLSVLYYREVDTTQLIFAICDSAGENRVQLAQQTTARAQFNIINGATTVSLQSANNTMPISQWHHFGVREWFDGSNRRVMYIDGVAQSIVSTTTVTVPSGVTAVAGARISSGSPAAFLTGRIAWACIRNAPLFNAEVEIEAATRNPFAVKPETIVHFWQLWGDGNESDVVGGVALTPTNSPAKADHPWITEQRPTLWLPYSTPPSDDRTATGALTTSAQTLSGSATNDAPEYDATGSLTASSQTLSGDATFADLPARFGEGELQTSSQTLSGSATHTAPVFEATGSLAASSQTLSGSATFSEAPPFLATGSLVASSQTLDGDAEFVSLHLASGSLIASPQSLTADATHAAPEYEATGSLTASAQTLSGSALFAAELFLATGSLSASSQTLSGSAESTTPEYESTGSLVVTSQVLGGVATFTPETEPLPDPVTAEQAVYDMEQWWVMYVQMSMSESSASGIRGKIHGPIVIERVISHGAEVIGSTAARSTVE